MKNKLFVVSMLSLTLTASAFAQQGTLRVAGSVATGDAALQRLDTSGEQQVFPFLLMVTAAMILARVAGEQEAAQLPRVPSQSVDPLFDR